MDTVFGKEARRGGRIEQTFPVVESGVAALDHYRGDRPALQIKMRCRHCDRILDLWRNYSETGRLWRGRDWETSDGQPRQYGIVHRGETELEDAWLRDLRRNQATSGSYVYRCHDLCRPDGPDRPGQIRIVTRRQLAQHIDTAAARVLDHVDLTTDHADALQGACERYGHFTI